MDIKRGDLYYVDLDKGVGSEQNGTRPVVIIQNDRGNQTSNTVIIAAITSNTKKKLPLHVVLPLGSCNLKEESMILLEQIYTIDKSRLNESDYIGHLDDCFTKAINRAILYSFGIKKERKKKNALQEHGTPTNIHDTGQKESQPLPQ